MTSEKKVAEAALKIAEAEKLLKTGFMKWRPDFDNAAQCYQEAATMYKTAKALDLCRETLQKAADCYVKNGSFFSAAKQLEQAALVSRDLQDFGACAGMFDRAANLYVESRSPDTAILVLERGAKIIQDKGQYIENAVQFYKRAAELASLEDKHRQAGELLGHAARLHMKLKDYDSAVNCVRQQASCYGDDHSAMGRFTVMLCLLQIGRGDEVAARKEFNEGLGYMELHQQDTLRKLLDGFDTRDDDLIRSALNDPFIKNMDTAYAKLARDIAQKFGGNTSSSKTASESVRSHASSNGDATASGNDESAAAADNDDLDFGGGLC